MNDQDMTTAPWTDDQVSSLNAFQDAGVFHPFTCGGCSNRDGLVAQNDGWHCPDCDYSQTWAHYWTADWSWVSLMVGRACPEKLRKVYEVLK
jgi:hypothetical protein